MEIKRLRAVKGLKETSDVLGYVYLTTVSFQHSVRINTWGMCQKKTIAEQTQKQHEPTVELCEITLLPCVVLEIPQNKIPSHRTIDDCIFAEEFVVLTNSRQIIVTTSLLGRFLVRRESAEQTELRRRKMCGIFRLLRLHSPFSVDIHNEHPFKPLDLLPKSSVSSGFIYDLYVKLHKSAPKSNMISARMIINRVTSSLFALQFCQRCREEHYVIYFI